MQVPLYVCVCVCVCMLRIVSRDKVLHFKNTSIIIIIILTNANLNVFNSNINAHLNFFGGCSQCLAIVFKLFAYISV